MSHYTRLELNWDDADYAPGSLTAEDILAAARPYIAQNDWSVEDVIADLREAASGRGLDHPGYHKMHALELIAMLTEVSRAFPDVKFFARGVGEECFDTWGRRLQAGRVLWEFGPFDPDSEGGSPADRKNSLREWFCLIFDPKGQKR